MSAVSNAICPVIRILSSSDRCPSDCPRLPRGTIRLPHHRLILSSASVCLATRMGTTVVSVRCLQTWHQLFVTATCIHVPAGWAFASQPGIRHGSRVSQPNYSQSQTIRQAVPSLTSHRAIHGKHYEPDWTLPTFRNPYRQGPGTPSGDSAGDTSPPCILRTLCAGSYLLTVKHPIFPVPQRYHLAPGKPSALTCLELYREKAQKASEFCSPKCRSYH
jgi:hypothetical protein